MTDIWTTRTDAARDALSRTRYAFVVATIVSVAITVAEFNSTFSWYEHFTQDSPPAANCPPQTPLQAPTTPVSPSPSPSSTPVLSTSPGASPPQNAATPNPSSTPVLPPVTQPPGPTPSTNAPSPTTIADKGTITERPPKQVAREAVIQEWVKSNRMTISLLGVNFGMSDAPILGSLSLAIISLWFYFCIRRENHLIAGILRDAQNATPDTQQRVFYGITGYLVFTTLTNGDEPIYSLEQPTSDEPFFLRRYIRIILYLPAIAIAFIMLSDAYSLLIPPAIRETCDPSQSLFMTLMQDKNQTRWFVQLIIMELVALAFFGLTLRICILISRFERATGHLLKRFRAVWHRSWDGESQSALATSPNTTNAT